MHPAGLVVSSAPGSICLWDPATLSPIREFRASDSAAGSSLAPYGDGFVAVQKDRKTLKYYGSEVSEGRTEAVVNCITAWKHVVAMGLDTGRVELWDSRCGGLLSAVAVDAPVSSLALTDRLLAIGLKTGRVLEYLLAAVYSGSAAPRFEYAAHSSAVSGLRVYRNHCFSASLDHTLAALSSGAVKATYSCDCAVTCVDYAQRRLFAGGSDGAVYCFSKTTKRWKWQAQPVTALCVLSAELLVAAELVYVVDMRSGAVLRSFCGHSAPVTTMVLLECLPGNCGPIHPLASSAAPFALTIPGHEAATSTVVPEDAEKLKSMNQWVYSLLVDSWL